tara:strand:- start:86 stop:1795 length:1710 start_codon:yes stop_codon:yes gene_type:complete
MVPKDLDENLVFRKKIIELGSEDTSNAKDIWQMCSKDLLFYVNTFCWTYDPRKPMASIPFLTYEYQDSAFLDMLASIGKRDILIQKSRDMGASWMLLTLFEWLWHFRDGQSFLLVSRNEDYVDKPGNPKSLFWKIDFLHKNQPAWMMPEVTRTKLRLTNERNGSSIDGESTTGDVARGDRRTAIGLDEFAAFDVDAGYRALASTRDATKCRIFNSTPSGSSNAFFDLAHKDEIKKVRLHWSQHPEKAIGLYHDDEGRPRSTWYDEECKRVATPREIAQELDIDYTGSDYQFFDPFEIDKLIKEVSKPAAMIGELEYEQGTGEIVGMSAQHKGRLQLWQLPDAAGMMPFDREYVIGADIATGTGSSNSVLSVGDCLSGEKVAEFVSPNTRPEELAQYAVALAKFFKGSNDQGAFLIWEAPGPGRNFGDAVLDMGYRRIFYRRNETSIGKKVSDIPGWWPTKDEKRAIYSDYRSAIMKRKFINRSQYALHECKEIIFASNGWVTHSKMFRSADPSGARENHGDRPTADALCWRGMRTRRIEPVQEITVAPKGSMAWRINQRKQDQVKKDHW